MTVMNLSWAAPRWLAWCTQSTALESHCPLLAKLVWWSDLYLLLIFQKYVVSYFLTFAEQSYSFPDQFSHKFFFFVVYSWLLFSLVKSTSSHQSPELATSVFLKYFTLKKNHNKSIVRLVLTDLMVLYNLPLKSHICHASGSFLYHIYIASYV